MNSGTQGRRVHQAYEMRLRSLYGDLVLETVVAAASAFKVALGDHLDESLGVRRQEARAVLSPVAQQRDIGRSPLRNLGRLDLDQVIPDPDQPRTEFAEEALERLAQSIRDKGQLSPIRVRWSAGAGKWIIVAGQRRWRATERAD